MKNITSTRFGAVQKRKDVNVKIKDYKGILACEDLAECREMGLINLLPLPPSRRLRGIPKHIMPCNGDYLGSLQVSMDTGQDFHMMRNREVDVGIESPMTKIQEGRIRLKDRNQPYNAAKLNAVQRAVCWR